MSRLKLSTTRGKKVASRFRRRLLLESLEDRRLLAASPTYMNDDWYFVSDVDASNSLTEGDLVAASLGGTNRVYGTATGNAFGVVTTNTPSGLPESLAAYDDIQDAVNGTTSGGTLNILPGVYEPASTIVVSNPLTILGPQAGVDPRTSRTPGAATEAVIDGRATLASILRIEADNVLVDGLEITNAFDAGHLGDMIESPSGLAIANPTLQYNIIHEAGGDEAVQLRDTTDALIQFNRVYRTSGDAIHLTDSIDGTIRNNLVYDVYSHDGAIYVYGSTGTTIEGNEVYDSHNNDGIKLGSNTGADAALSGGLIQNNVVHDVGNGGDGITVYMSGVTVSGNEVYNTHSVHGAIFVQFAVNDVIIEDNNVHDNTNPPPAGGQDGTAGVKIGRSDDTPIFVTVRNNQIVDNDWGILVDASTALIEGNDLTGNEIGVRIQNGALVDLGSIEDPGDGNSNPTAPVGGDTGLDIDGSSRGLNILTGYTGIGGNYAIQNLNLVADGDPDVKAENNMFGTTNPADIEAVVYHNSDDSALTVVDFDPPAGVVGIIDDGDPGFTTVGVWTVHPSGFNVDNRFSSAGTGSNTATWTFGGLADGLYRVSATWTAFSNRATNSPFTIRDGASPIGTVLINQLQAPNDFSDAGASWEDLGGLYPITSSVLQVQLTNAANNYVIADAIRIERVGQLPGDPGSPTIVDNGAPSYADAGFWQTAAGGFGSNYRYSNAGTGADTATWSFAALPSGLYRVAATWVAFTNRASNAPYSILDGATLLARQTVNQKVAPGDFSASGANWEVLGGLFPITSGSLQVRLSDAANNYVIADAVLIQRVGDLLGPEIQVSEGGADVPDETGSVSFGTTAQGEPVSRTFTVRNLGSQDLTLSEPINVPAGFSVAPSFGSLTVPAGESTTFVVQMDASAIGTYSGQLSFGNNDSDENPFNFSISGDVATGRIIDDGDPGFSTVGVWSLYTPSGFDGDNHYNKAGSGNDAATWTFSGLSSGVYQVAATWVPYFNRATDAPFTVYNGTTALQTVLVNQELAPDELTADGADWDLLGEYAIDSGTLRVRLTDAANEYVIADAIRVVRVGDLPSPAPTALDALFADDAALDDLLD